MNTAIKSPLEQKIEEQGFHIVVNAKKNRYALVDDAKSGVIYKCRGPHEKALERLYEVLIKRISCQERHRLHARRRCKQRFGFKMSACQYEKLCNQIKQGINAYCICVQKGEKNRTIWAVWFQQCWLPVVYDKKVQVIVTVLPRRRLLLENNNHEALARRKEYN